MSDSFGRSSTESVRRYKGFDVPEELRNVAVTHDVFVGRFRVVAERIRTWSRVNRTF
jgi:hypothetical protein